MILMHYGLFNSNEPQHALRDSLRGVADTYIEHSWVNDPANARKDFHRLMAQHNPDAVFMQIQCPDIIRASTLVRYPNVKFFNFNGDVTHIFPKWHFDLGPYCTTLFNNTDWVDIMTKRGFQAKFFQIGFDHNIYKPQGRIDSTPPVVFMGNNHGNKFPLSKLRGEMVERFSKYDWFQVYGRGWKGEIDLNYKQEKEASIYRGAKIAINLSHMDLNRYTSDRLFRLMGSGCMCLAYDHKGIREDFENGFHLVTWNTLDELEHEIKKWLSIDDLREKIADNGCNLVHKSFIWPARMYQDLIPLL